MTRLEELAAIETAIKSGKLRRVPPETDSTQLDAALVRLRNERAIARHPLGRRAKHKGRTK